MKKLLLLLFIISGFAAKAKNYYISSALGNDANTGTSATTPWKTLSKLNAFTGLVAGDQVLFNRGETFYGSIIVKKSGNAGSPIVYGAYGTGANPVITGFTKVSAWTNVGTNLWESTAAVSTLMDMNCVVINNVNTAMGRFPNTNYFITDTHVGTTSITSSSLTGTNWTGADLVLRTWNFAIARNLITASSGSTLTYKNTTPDNGHDGYGFFIENDVRTLDAQNEWYYNPSTKKIRIYGTSAPANIQVATVDSLVYMVSKNNVTFDGIDFTGSNRRAFYIGSCANVTIQNCNFNYHGLYAIWGGNNHGAPSSNFNFNHNTVNHVNSQGVVMQSEFVNPYIGYNTFKNCGVLPGMFKVATAGGQWDGAYGSIFSIRTNGLVVEYNSIDSTGYTGIHFTGNNTRINNNEVAHHCLLLMDGGGIYTWTGPSGTPTTGSKIYNNIVHDGFGNNTGTTEASPLCQGLYLDENTRNTEVYNNTFFNNAYGGIFSNSNTNCNFHHNTCYNNVVDQILCSSNYSLPTEKEQDNILKNNIFVAKTATQLTAKFTTRLDDIASFFTVADSNYYARPIDDNVSFFTSINHGGAFGHYTLAQWQAYIGKHDIHSKKSPKAVTSVNDMRIEYNASTVSKTITLDGNYVDVKNKSYNGTITLAPYTSAVLIRNGAATVNKAPVAKAGNDQAIILPASGVSLTGSGTDSDGTISAYSWTKISGPASGTITNASSAATTVTAMAQGTYEFQLMVTDNGGATGLDTIKVTVNISGNIAPTANAGADQVITLPTSSVSLSGIGTDSDGTISSYSWTKISGPTGGTITSASSANTTITSMALGIYQFQLMVADNAGATKLDTVQVTVNTAGNISPAANAGADQAIALPTSTVTLSGSGTDSDGTISAYSWTKISGPVPGTITRAASAASTVTGLVQGVYQFQLKVTDNKGSSSLDNIQVTVNAASNLLPAVNPANTTNGLDYKYYESPKGYTVVPDFSTISPVKSGSTPNFNVSLANRAITHSFNFTGFVTVPADGQYTFYTTSDDGSKLYIDNVLVVNNDGQHGAIEKSGVIGLKAGKHAISVGYFQQGGGKTLTAAYSGPGITKKAIPASALYRIVPAGSRVALDNNEASISSAQIGVKAYPNPFDTYIEISVSGGVAGEYKLMLVDASGKIVWTKSGIKDAGSFKQTINTSAFLKGMYFLKIVQKDTNSTIKLVK